MLKSFIVEDEQSSRANLERILDKYCNNVINLGSAGTVAEAVKKLPHLKPDIVFLDIELPGEKGFKLFEYLPDEKFQVVFTTAYSKYAIKAFNYSAIHYVLKPIDIEELQSAIKKVEKLKNNELKNEQLSIWKEVKSNDFKKIVLPTQDGLHFIETRNIVWCEAKSNYTLFHIIGRENLLVSKTLKTYEEILEKNLFFRASRSSLINLNHIIHCSNHKKMEITMMDGSVIPLSDRRKIAFKDVFSEV